MEEIPPHLNFAPLENAIEQLARSAERFDQALNAKPPEAAALGELNRKLIDSERQLTDPEGLPGRPWFKHLVYAPGWYTGYGVKTLPGVREAIEQKRWQQAEAEIVRVARVLAAQAALLESAAAGLR
jgi:N-acetylated-alpha-linked acidic dipeptidase